MPDEPPTRGNRSSTKIPRKLVTTVLLSLLGLTIGSFYWPSSSSRSHSQRVLTTSSSGTAASDHSANHVGAVTCGNCHPGEAALQARSGHSRTLRQAVEGIPAEWLAGRTFRDPEQPDVAWSF